MSYNDTGDFSVSDWFAVVLVSGSYWSTLKRKCLHFDEIFITGCTESCQNDNFRCSQWWNFHQNDDIFVSVQQSKGARWESLHPWETVEVTWDSRVETLRWLRNGYSYLYTAVREKTNRSRLLECRQLLAVRESLSWWKCLTIGWKWCTGTSHFWWWFGSTR